MATAMEHTTIMQHEASSTDIAKQDCGQTTNTISRKRKIVIDYWDSTTKRLKDENSSDGEDKADRPLYSPEELIDSRQTQSEIHMNQIHYAKKYVIHPIEAKIEYYHRRFVLLLDLDKKFKEITGQDHHCLLQTETLQFELPNYTSLCSGHPKYIAFVVGPSKYTAWIFEQLLESMQLFDTATCISENEYDMNHDASVLEYIDDSIDKLKAHYSKYFSEAVGNFRKFVKASNVKSLEKLADVSVEELDQLAAIPMKDYDVVKVHQLIRSYCVDYGVPIPEFLIGKQQTSLRAVSPFCSSLGEILKVDMHLLGADEIEQLIKEKVEKLIQDNQKLEEQLELHKDRRLQVKILLDSFDQIND